MKTITSSDPPTSPPVGRRQTRQKRALAELMAHTDTFRSAQDLHAALRAAGERMGLTTVYNQLRGMAEAGSIDTLRNADGEVLYRRCSAGTDHHHHLVCRACGRTVEVEGREIEKWAASVAATEGFTQATHTVEIFGLCPSCSASTG